jgi:hypothetical protein
MAGPPRKTRNLIGNIKPLRPPLNGVIREVGVYPLRLEPDLKLNINAPTGPDLLPVLLTQKTYLHNKK